MIGVMRRHRQGHLTTCSALVKSRRRCHQPQLRPPSFGCSALAPLRWVARCLRCAGETPAAAESQRPGGARGVALRRGAGAEKKTPCVESDGKKKT